MKQGFGGDFGLNLAVFAKRSQKNKINYDNDVSRETFLPGRNL
jgi:hypothetical protein